MNLKDLPNGSVIQVRNGVDYLKVDNYLLNLKNLGNFLTIEDYDDNGYRILLDSEFDIMKINSNAVPRLNYPLRETQKYNVKKWTWERKDILTKEEKEYLRFVIKPFKDRIIDVKKTSLCGNGCYLRIKLLNYDDCSLPIFTKDEMFRNMEVDKAYTLKELDL